MKKGMVVVLGLAMVMGMAACGAKEPAPAPVESEAETEAESETEAEVETEAGEEDVPDVGMPSPMVEMGSLEELAEAAGCSMVKPEGVEIADEAFNMIEGEYPIAEYSFTADGTEAFLRFSTAPLGVDISGIYAADGALFEGQENPSISVTNDTGEFERWQTVDGQYVFGLFDSNVEWAYYDALCSQFKALEPASWTSEVPYSTYYEMTGFYLGEDGLFGAISMNLDHVTVSCMYEIEDLTRVLWEAEAVYDGEKLVYESAKRTLLEYDEDYAVTETPMDDDAAGYVMVVDGNLDFSGVADEGLAGKVIPPMEN